MRGIQAVAEHFVSHLRWDVRDGDKPHDVERLANVWIDVDSHNYLQAITTYGS